MQIYIKMVLTYRVAEAHARNAGVLDAKDVIYYVMRKLGTIAEQEEERVMGRIWITKYVFHASCSGVCSGSQRLRV